MKGMSENKEARIIDELMHQIVSNRLEPGTRLPSENKLANKYSVPRMTVRSAFAKLEQRGYIYSKQGKGRFLKEKSRQIELHLTGKNSFTEKMKNLGHDLKTRNIYCEQIDYDAKIYHILQAEKDGNVHKIGRVRYINGEPMALHSSFVSEEMFPMIKKDGHAIESMFSYYHKLGYTEFTSSKSMLSVAHPTLDEQSLLACNSLVPLLIVETDCIDVTSKRILEYTKIIYRSDKFKYDITID